MPSGATPRLSTRRADPGDAALLASIAASSFHDTFAAANTPEDMALYMAQAFGETVQRAELQDERLTIFFAESGEDVVGYAMMRDGVAPPCVASGAQLEIVRLYSVAHRVGSGVGSTLMQRCLDEARSRGCDTVWLGVWERNARAIEFYTRWGFADSGRQTFQLGSDLQTDRVMTRAVSAS